MTTDPARGAGYFAADAEGTAELERLRLLEAEFDQHTFRYLDATGVAEGWRCLEVGAGAGSVVRWLSGRVGPTGRVVAADLDPRFIGDLNGPNIEVRQCDITRDDIEPDYYDLVHSRLVVMHLDDPADVLRRMATALRPGGWLVDEEMHNGDIVASVDPTHPLAEDFDTIWRKGLEFLVVAGIMDPWFGKVLPTLLDAVGLVETGNIGTSRVCRGGDPLSLWWRDTWLLVNETLIARGVVSESELAHAMQAFEDPTFMYRAYLMQSVWGRKP